MEILKQSSAQAGGLPDAAALVEINRLSKKPLTEEEVYPFSVRLCDNEIDRDWERFPAWTLEQLAPLFVGKSGVFDHTWSAKGQTARIYRTELVHEEGVVAGTGEKRCYLKGYAYMLRTEKNRDLIAEIEGGIKNEVSVGCAVERSVCSVCGKDMGTCAHVKGRKYDGKLCFASLEGGSDAYEWSFVAVPAQRKAGVMKKAKRESDEPTRARAELERLEREAALGRRYLAGLRDEVVRLGTLASPGLEGETLKSIAQKLDEGELLQLRQAYRRQAGERYPVGVQLSYQIDGPQETQKNGAFLI